MTHMLQCEASVLGAGRAADFLLILQAANVDALIRGSQHASARYLPLHYLRYHRVVTAVSPTAGGCWWVLEHGAAIFSYIRAQYQVHAQLRYKCHE